MAAIVCHGLQSHLESPLVESRTLRFRLPSSKPPQPPIDLPFKSCFWDSNSSIKTQLEEEEENNTIQDKPINNTSSWSFLEALSNVSTKEPSKQKKEEEEGTYVHPQQKRSSMALSPRSLELCTENLGNESGTDIVENGIDMMLSSLETGEEQQQHVRREQQQQPRQNWTAKKARTANFPPPLTTIRGSKSLRVRPHREDGRLVIEVSRVPPPKASCFQAERSHGRLRLCFLNNRHPSFDPQEGECDDDVDVVEENEPTTNEDGFEEEEEEFENDVIGQDVKEEEEETEEEGTEEVETEEEEIGDFYGCGCEMMRMEKFEIEMMPRRCNDGGGDHHHENNELLFNWGESFWVATS